MSYPVAAVRGHNHQLAGGGGAANWWEIAGETCVAAYQAIGAADLATSYVNLANPGTFDAAPGTAPTFNAATGWTFNGSTQYLVNSLTGFNLASGAYSMFVRYSDVPVSTDTNICGCYWSDNYTFLIQVDDTNSRMFATNTGNFGGNGMLNSPVLLGGVYGFAGQTAYRDGVEETGDYGLYGADDATQPFVIGGANVNGVVSYFTGKIQALAIYSTTLDSTQAATLSTAMAALT